MAGSALSGIPALASLAQKGASGARAAMGLQGPVMAGSQIIKGAVPAVGLAVAPSVIGNVAGAVSRPVQSAAGTAAKVGAGVIGYTSEGEPVYDAKGGALPAGIGKYGSIEPYGSTLEVLGPEGLARVCRLERMPELCVIPCESCCLRRKQ